MFYVQTCWSHLRPDKAETMFVFWFCQQQHLPEDTSLCERSLDFTFKSTRTRKRSATTPQIHPVLPS